MKKLICLFCLLVFAAGAQAPSMTLTSVSGSYSITCANPSLNFAVSCSSAGGGVINIVWMSPSFNNTGPSATISTPGTYTVTASNGTASASQVFTVYMNVTAPVSSISSTFQVITSTMTPAPVTVTAISPTLNIHHEFYAPSGGTVVANSATSVYQPGSPGTYTHCIIDDANGCSSCQPFTIQYGSPGTVSIAEISEDKNSFSIYPNPTKDRINIKISDNEKDFRFNLYSSRGELLRNDILPESGKCINVDDLPNGIYLLQLKGTTSPAISRRFVISR